MKISKISKKDYRVSTWSGGETQELYLFPVQGTYQVGQFDVRLSSASVQLAESYFTRLPGYQRVIMSLDNPLRLSHQGKDSKKMLDLMPFISHHFSGDDQTTSIGTCRDFNLIYRDGLAGELVACYQKESVVIKSDEFVLVYALEEIRVEIFQGDQVTHTHLKIGNSVVIEEVTENYWLVLTAKNRTEKPIAVVASISES